MLSQKQIKRKYMIRLFKTSLNLSPTSTVNVTSSIPAILKMPSRISMVPFATTTNDATHTTMEIQEKNIAEDEITKGNCSDTVSLTSTKSWIAESDISFKGDISQKIETKNEKKVRFSTSVRVCLIPTRHEFLPISSQLWWESEEYAQFKKEAYHEMAEYCQEFRCHPKDAMFYLYQPNDDDEDQQQQVDDDDEEEEMNELMNRFSPLSNNYYPRYHHHPKSHHTLFTQKQQQQQALSSEQDLYSLLNKNSPVPNFKSKPSPSSSLPLSPISSLKLKSVHHISSMDETAVSQDVCILVHSRDDDNDEVYLSSSSSSSSDGNSHTTIPPYARTIDIHSNG